MHSHRMRTLQLVCSSRYSASENSSGIELQCKVASDGIHTEHKLRECQRMEIALVC